MEPQDSLEGITFVSGCNETRLVTHPEVRASNGGVSLPAKRSASGYRIQLAIATLVLLLFAGAMASLAQDAAQPVASIEVRGTVRTTENSPVPGATLRVANTDTKQAWVSWTDESGKFEFPALPAGHYSIESTQLGFETATTELQLGFGPAPPPIQILLRVATLAELTAKPETSAGARRPRGPGTGGPPGQGNPAAPGNPPGAAGRGGGRGQIPAGLLNAMRQGLGNGGFQQTDLTGEQGAGGQGEEGAPQTAGGEQASLTQFAGGGTSSDSFLLQGTVGQGLSFNPGGGPGGFGGPGGGGPPGMGQGGPGGPGGQGGPGGAQGFALAGGGMPGGAGGLQAIFRGGAGGGGGGAARFLRQQVNRLRFTIFDRYTSSAFDAKPYSINGAQLPQIASYDERVGGTVGGPLKIPHIYNGSDKTYFFANYQHDIQRSPVNTFSTVPTADERNGLFCVPASINGMPPPLLVQPFTTVTFPEILDANCATGNAQQIPASDFVNNKAVEGLLGFIPPPNLPGAVQNYLLQARTPQDSDNVNTRVLHTINSKFNVNGGYNINSVRGTTLSNFAGIGGTQSTLGQSVDLTLSHNWSTHVVESMTLNWSRSRVETLSDNSYGRDIAADLGITGVSPLPIDFGIPQISFTDFSGLNDPIPSLVRNQTLRFSDQVTWVHGSHNMRYGGEVRRIQLNSQSDPNPRGGFIFTGIATGSDFADFLLDRPFNTAEQFGNPNVYLRSWGFSAYGQDDFRVTKTFSLQYGLRYDAVTPPIELFDEIVNLNITNLANVVQVAYGQPGLTAPGLPRALIHGRYDNFEPRLGFAWQPKFIKPKTVVRGGYSIFYNESIYNTLVRELTHQAPVSTSQTLTTTASEPLTLENGFLPPVSGGAFIPNTESVDPFYKPGYAQIWNLGTETSFSPSWILDLTYTGTKGTDLDILRAPNRAPLGTLSTDIQAMRIDPNATGFTFDQSGANSIYNALQVRVMHRFTHGLMLQGIYTYGKSLDDASSIGGGAATVEQQDGNVHGEYGLSTFDIRHQMRILSMYELPFGQRNRWANHGWPEKVFSNWRLQNIVTWQTGTPATVLLGGVASDNGTGANFSLRPDITGNPNLEICGGSPTAFFRTGVFALPVDANGNLAYGDEPRGAVEGPCQFNWNVSLAKTIRFGPEQRRNLNLSWQVQNLTNTPSFTGLSTALPCFSGPPTGPGTASGIVCGLGTGTGSSFFGRVTGAGSMRTMAMEVRIIF